jgi:hypothetical protein
MADIVVLSAEAQAASSTACAYRECTVAFVSDNEILDGSDLPNVWPGGQSHIAHRSCGVLRRCVARPHQQHCQLGDRADEWAAQPEQD